MKWYQPIECDNTVKNPLVCEYVQGYFRTNFTYWLFIYRSRVDLEEQKYLENNLA